MPAGSIATFEELALPLLAPLYNHARWLVQDHAEAEDLTQETIAKALRAFHSFAQGTNFKAWIFRIQRNAFLTSRTGIAVARTLSLEDEAMADEMPGDYPTPEDILIRLDNRAALEAALQQLSLPLRETLLLCEVEGLKYREIAEVLGVPLGTVMSRIARARRTMRQLLQPALGRTL